MNSERLVTVIIPTYNRGHLIAETVRSVLDQTYPLIEILVVDDGSTDDTPAVIDRLTREHARGSVIRFIRQSNSGAPVARNRGLAEASGTWIQFLDSDDGLFPEKLSSQVSAFTADPTLDMVYCQCKYWHYDDSGQACGSETTGEPSDDPVGLMLRRCFFHINAPLWQSSVCNQAGPWDVALPSSQDWEYGFRLLLCCRKTQYLSDTLTWARRQKKGSIGGLPDRVQCEAAVAVRLSMLDRLRSLEPELPSAWKKQCLLGTLSQVMFYTDRGHPDLIDKLMHVAREMKSQGWGGLGTSVLLTLGRTLGWDRVHRLRLLYRNLSFSNKL